MSDYTKATDFTAKDGTNAVFYGAHHDAEFDAIATAVATKANKVASPTSGNIATQAADGDIQDSGVAASQVTTNTTNIATNTSTISSHATTISSHATSISTNATDIASLQGGIPQAALQLGTPESVGTGTSKTAALSGTVEEVTVTLKNVSTDNTGYVRIQLGTSSTLKTSGYSTKSTYNPGSGYDTLGGTFGFLAGYYTGATENIIGEITFRHLGSNLWLGVGSFVIDSNQANIITGYVTLSGALDIVGLVAATGNFDSGTWAVDYRRSA